MLYRRWWCRWRRYNCRRQRPTWHKEFQALRWRCHICAAANEIQLSVAPLWAHVHGHLVDHGLTRIRTVTKRPSSWSAACGWRRPAAEIVFIGALGRHPLEIADLAFFNGLLNHFPRNVVLRSAIIHPLLNRTFAKLALHLLASLPSFGDETEFVVRAKLGSVGVVVRQRRLRQRRRVLINH